MKRLKVGCAERPCREKMSRPRGAAMIVAGFVRMVSGVVGGKDRRGATVRDGCYADPRCRRLKAERSVAAEISRHPIIISSVRRRHDKIRIEL
jgi:hypothetical protein